MIEIPFAASGVLAQGGFAALILMAGLGWNSLKWRRNLFFPKLPLLGCGFLSFLPFYRDWMWKWLFTEIKSDLETLWQLHNCLEYYDNGHHSTKETMAALLFASY